MKWPIYPQVEKILQQVSYDDEQEVWQLIRENVPRFTKLTIETVSLRVFQRCEKKELGEVLHFVALFSILFYEHYRQNGEGYNLTPKDFKHLKSFFRESELHSVYLYFSDNAQYIPRLLQRPGTLTDLQEEYIDLLTQHVDYLNESLHCHPLIIDLLETYKEPIKARYLLFQDTRDFGACCLLIWKRGQVFHTKFQHLNYLWRCRKKSVLSDETKKDAILLLLGLYTSEIIDNPLEEGRKFQFDVKQFFI